MDGYTYMNMCILQKKNSPLCGFSWRRHRRRCPRLQAALVHRPGPRGLRQAPLAPWQAANRSTSPADQRIERRTLHTLFARPPRLSLGRTTLPTTIHHPSVHVLPVLNRRRLQHAAAAVASTTTAITFATPYLVSNHTHTCNSNQPDYIYKCKYKAFV